MNEVVGYDSVGSKRFPRFSGPCKGCGATNYGLSTSGPEFCGNCAMGVPPELSKLQRQHRELGEKYTDALLALQILTGVKVEFMTDLMRRRGQAFLDHFKADTPVVDAPASLREAANKSD